MCVPGMRLPPVPFAFLSLRPFVLLVARFWSGLPYLSMDLLARVVPALRGMRSSQDRICDTALYVLRGALEMGQGELVTAEDKRTADSALVQKHGSFGPVVRSSHTGPYDLLPIRSRAQHKMMSREHNVESTSGCASG